MSALNGKRLGPVAWCSRAIFVLASAGGMVLSFFVAGAMAEEIPAGSYIETCRNIIVDGDLSLTAECQDSGGAWESSTIDRPFYCTGGIDNISGQLRCAERERTDLDLPLGSYLYSCRDAKIYQNQLEADCQDSTGAYIGITSVQGPFPPGVDVANCDGQLYLGGC